MEGKHESTSACWNDSFTAVSSAHDCRAPGGARVPLESGATGSTGSSGRLARFVWLRASGPCKMVVTVILGLHGERFGINQATIPAFLFDEHSFHVARNRENP